MAVPTTSRQYYALRLNKMKSDFQSWRNHLEEIKDYLMPWNGRGLTSDSAAEVNDGDKKQSNIFDHVPQSALSVLAGGMQSGLTSPARPWFRLATPDPDLNDFPPVKEWLHSTEERMRTVFGRSNFYDMTHMMYFELGGFGTACASLEFDFETVIRARTFTAGQYYLEMNQRRQVDTMARVIYMTAKQMVEKFGKENVSQSVRKAVEDATPAQRFKVVQFIEPNDDDFAPAGNLQFSKAYRSVYYEPDEPEGENKFLGVGGFDEFPILAPRWNVTAEDVYGHSLGMDLLPDIKGLYAMMKQYLQALHKIVNPTLVAPDGMKDEHISTVPGGLNFEPSAGQGQGLRPVYEVNLRLAELMQMIQEARSGIRTGFFNDLFLMLSQMDRSQMTATEVAERHEEKIIMLGPVLEKLHSELLDPAIDRTFGIMLRNGLLEEPPEELAGAELKVEYISILAQAQKMVGTAGLEQALGFAGNLAGVHPEILDKIDFDKTIEHYFDFVGVPPDMLREQDEVDAVRQARAQMQQAQQMAETVETGANSAKLLSEADTQGPNALNALMGGIAGGPVG